MSQLDLIPAETPAISGAVDADIVHPQQLSWPQYFCCCGSRFGHSRASPSRRRLRRQAISPTKSAICCFSLCSRAWCLAHQPSRLLMLLVRPILDCDVALVCVVRRHFLGADALRPTACLHARDPRHRRHGDAGTQKYPTLQRCVGCGSAHCAALMLPRRVFCPFAVRSPDYRLS